MIRSSIGVTSLVEWVLTKRDFDTKQLIFEIDYRKFGFFYLDYFSNTVELIMLLYFSVVVKLIKL